MEMIVEVFCLLDLKMRIEEKFEEPTATEQINQRSFSMNDEG